MRAFESANDRAATPAERKLLRDLAARFEPVAAAAQQERQDVPGSGWGWLEAAVWDALKSRSLDEWQSLFQRAKASDFLSGRDGKYPPMSLFRVLDIAGAIDSGEHDNRPPQAPRGHRPYGVGPAAVSSSVAVVDPDYNGAEYRWHCGHTPTCTTWPQCRDHINAEAAAS